jgi:FtsP/CotA-like multicopper oxidase with cupredoxin domain
MDGTPTTKGDVIYLTNTLKMDDGRKPDGSDPSYKVPILKIVIGDVAPDDSLMPGDLRPCGDADKTRLAGLPQRTFELERSGSAGGEIEWLINGFPFRLGKPLALPMQGRPEVWTIKSGGGWGHPMHIHQEEHRILARNGRPTPTPRGRRSLPTAWHRRSRQGRHDRARWQRNADDLSEFQDVSTAVTWRTAITSRTKTTR